MFSGVSDLTNPESVFIALRANHVSSKVFANIARTEIEAMEMKAWLDTLPMHSYGSKSSVAVEPASSPVGADEKSEERTNLEEPPEDESPNNIESHATPVANGTKELAT